MLSAPPPIFDYGRLDADITAALRLQAERIRCQVRLTTRTIIEVGRDLIAVKQHLEHGQFCEWVRAECGFTERSAQNYIRAAEFAEGKYETVSLLPPATVYKLAAKTAPAEIVTQVIEHVSAGQSVSDQQVEAALTNARWEKREAKRKALAAKSGPVSKKTRESREAKRKAYEDAERLANERALTVARQIAAQLGDDNLRALEPVFNLEDGWRTKRHLEGIIRKLPVRLKIE